MTRTEKIDDLIATVKGYADLPYNWDTYRGKPACEEAIAFAVKLLEAVKADSSVPVPTVSPISTGVYIAIGDGCDLEVDWDGVMRWDLEDEDAEYDVDAAMAALRNGDLSHV